MIHMNHLKKVIIKNTLILYRVASLIDIVNIIECAHNCDTEKFKELMDKLPWRDSGTGDNISSEATMFVWWILSDETKNNFTNIMLEYCKKANYETTPSRETIDFVFSAKPFEHSLGKKNLKDLIEHNKYNDKLRQEWEKIVSESEENF